MNYFKKLGSLTAILLVAPTLWAQTGFEFDIAYWRITNGETRLKESVSSGINPSEDSFLGGVSNIGASKTVLDIEGDPSKFLLDARYRFINSLHRLTVGFQWAGTGNDTVKEVGLTKQVRDFLRIATDFNFNAISLNYSHLYASYRLFPMAGEPGGVRDFMRKGIDIWLSHVSLKQEFEVVDDDFSLDNSSLGIGVGGVSSYLDDRLIFKGRFIYLPFLSDEGSGWDIEFRLAYEYSDLITLFFGGKFLSIETEADATIKFTGVGGFDPSGEFFKDYEADLGGYTLGIQFRF